LCSDIRPVAPAGERVSSVSGGGTRDRPPATAVRSGRRRPRAGRPAGV